MANRTALSPSYTDVNNAINGGGPFSGAASDGSIITIPAGMATWPSTMLITNKAITLQGHGIGQTIIKDGIVGSASPFLKILTKTGSALSPATDQISRLTNIEFQDGGRTVAAQGTPVGPPNSGGVINISALDNRHDGRFRWDNCKTDHLIGSVVFDTAVGLVDNNQFLWGNDSWCKIWHANWNGGRYADTSMSAIINWGSENFIYLQENIFTCDVFKGAVDSYCGGRSVWRDNFLNNATITSHGTETGGGRMRGLVAMEIYRNHWTSDSTHNPSAAHIGSFRSGVVVIWGNRVANNMTATSIPLAVYRPFIDATGAGYGECNGKNNFDVNYPGGPFRSGVADSGGTNTMKVVPSPGWGANIWRGYSVVKKTGLIAGQNAFSMIVSNTVDTITYAADTLNTSKTPTFSNGDQWEFWRINHCLDQPGRRGGAVIPSVNPAILPDGSNPSGDLTADWRNNQQDQVSDPCYQWDNKREDESHPFVFGIGQSYTIRPVVGGDDGHYIDGVKPGYVPLGTHSLSGDVVPPTQIITSVDHTSIPTTGGTFQCTDSFTSSPTYSHNQSNTGGSFPASGTSLSNGGLLTVGAGSTAGTYQFNIVATQGSNTDTQLFTLTITDAPTKVIAISGTLAFGDVDVNTTSQRNITIQNTGNTTLTVMSITLPSGFTSNWSSGTLLAGASQLVTITLSPVAAASYSGTVTVVSDKTSGTNTVAASGVGVARALALTGSLVFGSITVGQTATRQLTMINNGNRALTVSSIAYPEGFSGDLTTATIAAGGSKILNVTFSPLAAQVYSGPVTITSDKTSGPNTASASGTGVSAPTKIIQLTGSLAFGTAQVGTTPTKVLTITNSGDSTLTVSGITYPTGFTGSYSGTIAAGASHDVTVTFTPVAATSYSGTVTVASDATDGANTTTASGTGEIAATRIVTLSGDLAFGSVVIGSSPTRLMTITNDGNSPLAVSSITLPTGFTGSYAGTLAPGASTDVTITFSPIAVQAYAGNITVASDKTSGTNTIATSGSGVAATTRIISIIGDLAFGNVQRNHSIQRIMTIANTGTGILSVTNITCPTGFSVNLTTATISPGASQDVTVTFRPTLVQAYSGTITVTSDKTAGTNTLSCSGNGTTKKQVPFMLIVG